MILADVQKKLTVPKSRWNDFGKYHYRSADDILSSVKRALPDGWAIMVTCQPELVGEWVYQACKVTLTNGKEAYSAEGWAREPESKKGMDASQVSGSTSSFAKKYALANLFAIDDEQDSDATNDGDSEAKPKPRARLNGEKLNSAVEFYCAAIGISKSEFPKTDICKAFVAAHPLETRTQEEQDAFAEALIEEASRR